MKCITKIWIYTFVVLLALSSLAGATGSGGGVGGTDNFFEALRMMPNTLSLTSDGINPSHELVFCRPVPTEVKASPPDMNNCNVFTLDFKDFPANNLPSGGASTRISPSEMAIVYLKLNNFRGSGSVSMSWYNEDTGKKLYSYQYLVPAYDNKGWTWWYVWTYSFIGRFDWEIATPGEYYVYIDTTWGSSRFDFTVVDTTPKPTPTPIPTPAPRTLTAPYTFYISPLPVTITVSTIGSYALNSNPFSYELWPGTYTYTIEKSGYISQSGSFTRLATSAPESRTITLQPIATPTPSPSPTPTPSPSPTPTPQPAPRAPGASVPPILSSLWGTLLSWFKSLGV